MSDQPLTDDARFLAPEWSRREVVTGRGLGAAVFRSCPVCETVELPARRAWANAMDLRWPNKWPWAYRRDPWNMPDGPAHYPACWLGKRCDEARAAASGPKRHPLLGLALAMRGMDPDTPLPSEEPTP